MTLEEHEARLRALEAARKEVEEALVVMAHLETRQSNILREMAGRTDELERERERQRALNAETDRRIADLVSAIGELIRRNGK